MNNRVLDLKEVTQWAQAREDRQVHVKVSPTTTLPLMGLMQITDEEVLYSYVYGSYEICPATKLYSIVAQARDYLLLRPAGGGGSV